MIGPGLQFDENSTAFLCFAVSAITLIMGPATYSSCRSQKPALKRRIGFNCSCPPCKTKHGLALDESNRSYWIRIVVNASIILGWALFAISIYEFARKNYDRSSFDPYAILRLKRSTSIQEIEESYRKLLIKYRPFEKGQEDDELMTNLKKAYAALTDANANFNWQNYGNPDGPTTEKYGLNVPSWLIEKENLTWVLVTYALFFFVIVPLIARSPQCPSDKNANVLPGTATMYDYLLREAPDFGIRRFLLILSSSMEFNEQHNPLVSELRHETKDIQQLLENFPDYQNLKNELYFEFPSSIKARALILSHISRIPLHRKSLQLDQQRILQKLPKLIRAMVDRLAELHRDATVALPHNSLTEVENAMRLSPMIVQAFWKIDKPLLQLPHIDATLIEACESYAPPIKTIKQLCNLHEDDRRDIFESLTDEQYNQVMQTCAQMPLITITIRDEDPLVVKTGSVVTLNLNLARDQMRTTDQFGQPPKNTEHEHFDSYPVHCPYFPHEKQESWWLYVCDRERNRLVTHPDFISSLNVSQDRKLFFNSPSTPETYEYSVCLRSDSYAGSYRRNFTLTVKRGKRSY